LKRPWFHLPKGWQDFVKSAVLHAIALAHYAIVYARAWAADSINARVRLAAESDRLHEACALLREELRIKDTRIAQIAPQRRPHYGPYERMAILELRAARGWSLKQTADTFFLTSATVTSWMKRITEKGPDALLHLREPVNIPASLGCISRARCWLFGAKTPWNRVRLTRGFGTSAANLAMKSSGCSVAK
jgi:hypothetical protein